MEYQGKELFRRVGIATPRGHFSRDAADVAAFVAENPGSWVLKSQVLMGGRGKAGGIKFADTPQQASELASELLGKVLKNVQNPDGERVSALLVEEKVAIASEAYVSITIDRSTKKPAVLVTAQGGRSAFTNTSRPSWAASTNSSWSTARISSRSIRSS
jgi:succinyl-CoA synthetase beta subunit